MGNRIRPETMAGFWTEDDGFRELFILRRIHAAQALWQVARLWWMPLVQIDWEALMTTE